MDPGPRKIERVSEMHKTRTRTWTRTRDERQGYDVIRETENACVCMNRNGIIKGVRESQSKKKKRKKKK